MENYRNKKVTQNGAIELVVVLVLVFLLLIGGSLWLLQRDRVEPVAENTMLPPVEERLNPAPTSGNMLFVESISPGTMVSLDEVALSQEGYVVVELDTTEGRKRLGKSELLEAGSYTSLPVNTSEMMDGDAVYIALYDSGDQPILDENDNPIEMLLNVGMLMGHEMLPDDQKYY